jgi:hypothetical protein
MSSRVSTGKMGDIEWKIGLFMLLDISKSISAVGEVKVLLVQRCQQ